MTFTSKLNINAQNTLFMKLVECVPNFSNGRDPEILEDIVRQISSVEGVKVLDREMDADHNRSVVTFIVSYENAVEAAFRGIARAAELIDMEKHSGEHPRFGAADVVPFIPISGCTIEECSELAVELARRVGRDLDIPVYLYGEAAASPSRAGLENIRSKNFQYEQLRERISEEKWKPDFGPAKVGRAGATIIGSRDFLIAYNVYLNTDNKDIGKKIAKALRAKDGGLTFVKALSFYIEEKSQVQISMNLTNFKKTPIYRAFELIRIEAARYGVSITGSEIVGLTPLDAILNTFKYYIGLDGFKKSQILEYGMLGQD